MLGADVNQATFAGRTPLHAAARYGKLDLVGCLVRVLGTDVHRQALDGSFALLIAPGSLQQVAGMQMLCAT
jgi:ankyrin repeat protein